MFLLPGINGLIHNFVAYTGKIDMCPGQPDLKASANIVLRLLVNIPRAMWHKVFINNWFNGVNFQATYGNRGSVACVGTVRANRLTYAAIEPITNVQRFDRKLARLIQVECPSIVVTYNQFMGGVDLFDSLPALYRITVRSKNWYHRLIFHFLELMLVQAWLLYRRDADARGIRRTAQTSLLQFKIGVADSLIFEEKGKAVAKRERPLRNTEAEHE